MGPGTDFVGHITVVPPLNATEAEYVEQLARSRSSGAAARWTTGGDGGWLVAETGDDPQALAATLRYLVDELLRPDARVKRSRARPPYDEFTFDHVLDGMVVGCRRDSGDLFAITARDNRIARRMLRVAAPGVAERASRRPAEQRHANVIDLAARRMAPIVRAHREGPS